VSARISSLRRLSLRQLVFWLALAGIYLLFVVQYARTLAAGSSLAFIASVTAVGMVVIAYRPFVGLYACYMLLILVPFTDARLDIPIFHSPLQAIALITVGAALFRFPMADRRLPKTHLYLPLAVVTVVYVLSIYIHHGPDPTVRFYNFAAGAWPLVLILLLVRTPRQARNVLIAMCATCVTLTIVWLPGLLAIASSKSGVLGDQIRFGRKIVGYSDNSGAVSLLGAVGALSFQTLVALAIVAPVLLGIGISNRRWRYLALFGYATISVVVFTATIASAVATLLLGTVFVLLAYGFMRADDRWAKVRGLASAILLVLILGAVGMALPPGQRAFERLTDPRNDASGELRISSLQQGWHAFLERPVYGQGVYQIYHVTPAGWMLEGHNTWGVMAYEYGLAMLLPFGWLLIVIAQELLALVRNSRGSPERGVAIGFLGAFVAAFLTGFFTLTFQQIFQDTIVWTLVGLAIVWNNWKRDDPDAVLMA
jgi:O-antigen ligase